MKIRGGPSSPISRPLSYSKITAVHEYGFPEKKTVLTSLRVNVFDGKERASGTRCAASDYSSSVTKSEILSVF